ncbi:hypothetical protein IFM89_008822 [Coptis chinensis]|uniref:Uncharacterized protein n=1 Tax=Coptis chinensis TaxID=261450 RepID=A0A835HAG7_9MAGN|nr:hypothetical protein IFM89_008822 [Coptis chinensis]
MLAWEKFCGEDWAKLQKKYHTLEKEDLLKYCFSSAYIVAFLHDSLGIALDNGRMLIVDPMKRMTIPEIRQHPWFQAHLPRYLAVPPPDTMQQAKKRMTIPEIRQHPWFQAHLPRYLAVPPPDTMQQAKKDSSFSRMHPSEPAASTMGHRFVGYMDYQGINLRPHFPIERKWALGLQDWFHESGGRHPIRLGIRSFYHAKYVRLGQRTLRPDLLNVLSMVTQLGGAGLLISQTLLYPRVERILGPIMVARIAAVKAEDVTPRIESLLEELRMARNEVSALRAQVAVYKAYAYHISLPMPITSCKFGSIDPISGQETDDDNGQFVSSVCWRGNSNTVMTANSIGSIKLLQLVSNFFRRRDFLWCFRVLRNYIEKGSKGTHPTGVNQSCRKSISASNAMPKGFRCRLAIEASQPLNFVEVEEAEN